MEPEVSLPCSQEPPLDLILNQINRIHTLIINFFNIKFNTACSRETGDYKNYNNEFKPCLLKYSVRIIIFITRFSAASCIIEQAVRNRPL
jgi:hypothetical protein